MYSHASMNRVFKLIWNSETSTWVPVSEVAGTGGRRASAARMLRRAARFGMALTLGMAALPGYSGSPQGAQVISGGVQINQSLPNQTQITQSTSKAIVNWNQFSVGADHTVTFSMPDASSISLNRVVGEQASRIDGQLLSNGQVWLLNPNGVLIGRGAKVNAQGFLASTRALSDEKFLANQYEFDADGNPTGAVVNGGQIIANNGGYAVLSGQTVRNEGLVQAKLGKVVVAGAEAFTVDVVGDQLLSFQVQAGTPVAQLGEQLSVENVGALSADGGRVLLSTESVSNVVQGVLNVGGLTQANTVTLDDGVLVLGQVDVRGGSQSNVKITGIVQAKGAAPQQQGGLVQVAGQHIDINSGALVDASGAAGGGKVSVGAGWRGQKISDQPLAETIRVEQGAALKADATVQGTGGDVVVFSDLNKTEGDTTVAGSLSARGAGQVGNGGRIETSGHKVNLRDARIDAGSEQAKAGQWLIDPTDVIIDQTMADAISDGLNNADVLVETSAPGMDFGDITVAANITYNGVNARSLTLKADRDVLFNPGVEIRSNNAALRTVLWADSDNFGDGRIYMPVNSGIYSAGGDILLGGGFGEFQPESYAHGRSEFQSNVPHGIGLFGANLISSGGAITLRGHGASLDGEQSVLDDAGSLLAATSRVNGVVVGTHRGQMGDIGSVVDSGLGRLDILGYSNSAFGVEGSAVYIHPLSVVRTTGNLENYSNIQGYAGGATSFVSGSNRTGVFNEGTLDATGSNLYITGFGGRADKSAGVKQWGDFLFDSGFSFIQGVAGTSNQAFNVVESGDISFLNGITGALSETGLQGNGGFQLSANTVHVGGNIQNISYFYLFNSTQNGLIDLGGQDVAPGGEGFGGVLGLDASELSRISTGFLYLGTSGQSSPDNVGIRVSTPIDFPALRTLYLTTPGTIELNADVHVSDTLYVQADNVLLSGNQRNITTDNGQVYFESNVNSAFDFNESMTALHTALNIDAGPNGFVSINGDVGAQNPLGGLTVNAPNGIYLYGDVFTNQVADVSGTFDFYIPDYVKNDFANNRSQTSNLILSLSEGASIEVGTTLVPGATNTGVAVVPSGNAKVSNNLAGSGSFPINNEDTYLAVYRDGVKVAENDDSNGGVGSYLNFQVPEGGAGTYTFAFGCFSSSTNCGGTAAYRSIGGGDSSSIVLNGFTHLDAPRTLRANSVTLNGHIYSAQTGTSLKLDASEAFINGNISGVDLLSVNALGTLSINNQMGAPIQLNELTVDGRLNLNVSGVGSAESLSINTLKVFGESNFDLNASSGTFLASTAADLGGVVTLNSNQNVVLNNQNDTFMGSSNVTGALTVNSSGRLSQLAATTLTVGQALSLQSTGNLQLQNIVAGGNIDLVSTPGMTLEPPMEEFLRSEFLPPSEGDVVLNQVVQSLAGDVKVVSAGNFISNLSSGQSALQVAEGFRYLVYSQAPELNQETGLNYNFRQHGVTSVDSPVLGTGNGFLYANDYFVTINPGQTFSKQYDGNAQALDDGIDSIEVSGFFSGDIATLGTNTPVSFNGANAGSQVEVFASQLVLQSLNNQGRIVYGALLDQESSSSILGTIDPKQLTAQFNAAVSKVYDGTTDTLDAGGVIALSGLVSGENISVFNAFGQYASKNAGTGIDVSVDLAQANYTADMGTLLSNYVLPNSVLQANNGQITPRALAVNYTGVNKVYDATTAAQVNTSDDRISGDQLSINRSASFVDKNAGVAKQINVSGIALSGVDAQNYTTAGTATANANITQRALAVNYTGVNKVYDATTAAQVNTSDDRISGDQLSINKSASFVDKNAGVAKQINVSGIALGGVDAQNYTTSGTATASADILRRTVGVSLIGSVVKTDNGNNLAALTPANYQVSGVLSGESLSVNQNQGTYATSAPGTNIPVSASLTNANLSDSNYAVTNNATVVTAPIGIINAAVSKSIATELNGALKSINPTTPVAAPAPAPAPASKPAASEPAPSSSPEPAQTSSSTSGGTGSTASADSGNQDADAENDTAQSSSPQGAGATETAQADTNSTSSASSGGSSQTSAPTPDSTPIAGTQTTVVAPPGGADNSPVAQTPPSPVGNTKPATPVDTADAGDSTLSAAKQDSPPEPASNAKRQVVGVTTVSVGGVPMQQPIAPSLSPSAQKEQRYSLTGNY